MKCEQKVLASQHTGSTPGETKEEPGPELPHSARSLQVMHAPEAHKSSEHRRVKWLQASKEKEWLQFDKDIDTILQATAKGQVEQGLTTMTTMIVSLAVERFGQEEKWTAKPLYTLNNRANKIHQLRQELKSLRQQFKAASEKERGPLAELRSIIRKRLMTLRRAEWHRRRRKERARRRAAFLANPFGFTKQLLGEKHSGYLVCSKAEVDHYLKETYSDESREQDLGPCQALINPSAPEQEFDGEEPIKRARASSAPGPHGVPYKVYKNCPRLLTRQKVIKVANQWRQAEGVWIPKEENSKNIEQFRTISLLSVEGKIFFSIVAKRLTEYLLKNSYIDNSVQKGGIPKVPGCLEHTGVNRGDLKVLWLDLANAYGSIPHKLVQQALNQYYIPEKFRNLILDYYADFHLRVSSGTITFDWHKLEKGIITGCTISPILFTLAMNILKDAASIQATNEDLETWLSSVDKSGLPGKFKAWIYQHGILPQILWPLLVYEVPISTVEGFEMRISRFLRSITLYGHNNKLKLPFSSLSKEFMVSRSRELLQYRESSDPRVAVAGIEVRTGRKWRAAEAVDIAVSRLQQRVIVGTVAQGRAGLGSSRKPNYDKAQGKERRSLILEEVRARVEEKRASQMVQSRHPSNLFTWEKVETSGCLLCQKRGTLEHILSCCPKALAEGRYRWRHDQAVADSICSGISHNKSACLVKNKVTFIKAREKPAALVRNTSPGLLAMAHDWELRVDLAKQLKFAKAAAKTTLRPDIVVTSVVYKQVILVELTVPWEDRMEEAHERKRVKYSKLVEECRSNGWWARCQPIEVGCRGFAGQSLCRAYKMLGIKELSSCKWNKCPLDSIHVTNVWW
ncbi:tetraspanin-7 [Sarotherodon galilaeus]